MSIHGFSSNNSTIFALPKNAAQARGVILSSRSVLICLSSQLMFLVTIFIALRPGKSFDQMSSRIFKLIVVFYSSSLLDVFIRVDFVLRLPIYLSLHDYLNYLTDDYKVYSRLLTISVQRLRARFLLWNLIKLYRFNRQLFSFSLRHCVLYSCLFFGAVPTTLYCFVFLLRNKILLLSFLHFYKVIYITVSTKRR